MISLAGTWIAVCLAVQPAPPAGERPLDSLPHAAKDEARAREAWEKGAAAFAAGDMREAIVQFEATHRYSSRPGPLFSLGQAHRHLWEQEGDPKQRLLALERYQLYLDKDPEGPRRLEAERWIKELMTQGELEDLGDAGRIFTRLGITSATPAATVRIDDGQPLPLPATPDVVPGHHSVIVEAPGFHAQRREVELPEGSTLPLQFVLEPVEARLWIRGPAGADFYVDGERRGRLPTASPLLVPPGTHQVGVAQAGRTLFVREIELERAQTHRVDATIQRTGQRKIAIAAVTLGAGAASGGAAMLIAALVEQRRALRIQSALERSPELGTPQRDLDGRDRAIGRRDLFRVAAIATGTTGLVVLAAGVVLWVTDRPPVASSLQRPANRGRATARVRAELSLDATGAAVGVGGRF